MHRLMIAVVSGSTVSSVYPVTPSSLLFLSLSLSHLPSISPLFIYSPNKKEGRQGRHLKFACENKLVFVYPLGRQRVAKVDTCLKVVGIACRRSI